MNCVDYMRVSAMHFVDEDWSAQTADTLIRVG